jgi:hypothetical protein
MPLVAPKLLLLPLLLCSASFAQINQLTVEPPPTLSIKRGGTASVNVKAMLRPGFHCNTNTPSDDYLIPLRLTFAAADTAPGVESAGIVYPKGKDEKYSFSNKPLNVYSGTFELQANFKAANDAKKGSGTLIGKLRYQACNDTMCFAPKTIEIKLPVVVHD